MTQETLEPIVLSCHNTRHSPRWTELSSPLNRGRQSEVRHDTERKIKNRTANNNFRYLVLNRKKRWVLCSTLWRSQGVLLISSRRQRLLLCSGESTRDLLLRLKLESERSLCHGRVKWARASTCALRKFLEMWTLAWC